jgi:hypothetical protein
MFAYKLHQLNITLINKQLGEKEAKNFMIRIELSKL